MCECTHKPTFILSFETFTDVKLRWRWKICPNHLDLEKVNLDLENVKVQVTTTLPMVEKKKNKKKIPFFLRKLVRGSKEECEWFRC